MIDLIAAYDHVDRDILFSFLNIRTKAPKITSILKALYTGTTASIKNTANAFQVHTGCRQGGIESPVLFKATCSSLCFDELAFFATMKI